MPHGFGEREDFLFHFEREKEGFRLREAREGRKRDDVALEVIAKPEAMHHADMNEEQRESEFTLLDFSGNKYDWPPSRFITLTTN